MTTAQVYLIGHGQQVRRWDWLNAADRERHVMDNPVEAMKMWIWNVLRRNRKSARLDAIAAVRLGEVNSPISRNIASEFMPRRLCHDQ